MIAVAPAAVIQRDSTAIGRECKSASTITGDVRNVGMTLYYEDHTKRSCQSAPAKVRDPLPQALTLGPTPLQQQVCDPRSQQHFVQSRPGSMNGYLRIPAHARARSPRGPGVQKSMAPGRSG